MFPSTEKHIDIPFQTQTGLKNVVVTFPTDDQWKARASKIKVTVKQLGRGKTQTDITPPEKANADLYDQVFVSGDEIDIYEKSRVVERLSRVQVEGCEIGSTSYTVTLKVPGGIVTHELKIPSAERLVKYRRAAQRDVVEERHGNTVFISNLTHAETLHDELIVKHSGYEADVPIIHKSAVVSEMLIAHDEQFADDDVQGF